jgi:hypothetical protein
MAEGPEDASIPANWEQGVKGWDSPSLGKVAAGGCETWNVIRRLIGPRRWGAPVLVGKPYVSAFYAGDCTWDLILVQDAVQKEFVLYEELDIQITRCGATSTEKIVSKLVGPEWRAVRVKKIYTAWQTLQTIVARDPGGLPCGEEQSWQGVPSSVKEAADDKAKEGGYGRGIDVPVAPPKAKPKPARPPMPPLPPPPDDHSWFWIWWSLGGWMLVPDPPWEPPGGHDLPHHGLEPPEGTPWMPPPIPVPTGPGF